MEKGARLLQPAWSLHHPELHPAPGPLHKGECSYLPYDTYTYCPTEAVHHFAAAVAQVFQGNGFESTKATQYPPSQVRGSACGLMCHGCVC